MHPRNESNQRISPAFFASVDYQILKLITEFNQEFEGIKNCKQELINQWIAKNKSQFDHISNSPNKLNLNHLFNQNLNLNLNPNQLQYQNQLLNQNQNQIQNQIQNQNQNKKYNFPAPKIAKDFLNFYGNNTNNNNNNNNMFVVFIILDEFSKP